MATNFHICTSVWKCLFLAVILGCVNESEALGTFGFDIHHRYSDSVKEFFGVDGLPEMGSLDYFTAMTHRDKLFRSRRRLAETDLLTFSSGNKTYFLSSLGFLHYAIVHVGTPKLSFLVALDTGSELFWLPCECAECVRRINITSEPIDLNQYSLRTSSTGAAVTCDSPICGTTRACSEKLNACVYQEQYLSANTSSSGILVNDVLHMVTHDSSAPPVEASITLGCGVVQTGAFLRSGAPNGLFGLGMDNISVPSILASKGLIANSFSMCFGSDGRGRIEFGDKGSLTQKTTPFNLEGLRPTYNVTIIQTTIGRKVNETEFLAVVDSGTSFTYLLDPVYSAIADDFNSQVTQYQRYVPDTQFRFQYCYKLNGTQGTYYHPKVNFTMKGGNHFFVNEPTIVFNLEGGLVFCLGIIKSDDINIIGQNFLDGYRLVFDRVEMVMGWEDSNCYDLPINNVPSNKPNSTITPSPPPSVPETGGLNRSSPFIPPPKRGASSVQTPSPPPPTLPGIFGSNDVASPSSFKCLFSLCSSLFHYFLMI